jgi:hypothetical protein
MGYEQPTLLGAHSWGLPYWILPVMASVAEIGSHPILLGASSPSSLEFGYLVMHYLAELAIHSLF